MREGVELPSELGVAGYQSIPLYVGLKWYVIFPVAPVASCFILFHIVSMYNKISHL